MVDLVVVALAVIDVILMISILQVKKKKNFKQHKKIQLSLAVILFIAVLLFELEIRFAGGIYNMITHSPYKDTSTFDLVLGIHLFFAITTTLLWIITVFGALKNFKSSFNTPYAKSHRRLGWLSAIDLLFTSFTGWAVYYMAFMA